MKRDGERRCREKKKEKGGGEKGEAEERKEKKRRIDEETKREEGTLKEVLRDKRKEAEGRKARGQRHMKEANTS